MALFLWQQHCDPHTTLAKETPKLKAGGRDVFRKVLPRDSRASLHMHSYCVLRALASLLTGGADTLCCARPPARCGNAECETPSCT